MDKIVLDIKYFFILRTFLKFCVYPSFDIHKHFILEYIIIFPLIHFFSFDQLYFTCMYILFGTYGEPLFYFKRFL
jgi:hypothetical protein